MKTLMTFFSKMRFLGSLLILLLFASMTFIISCKKDFPRQAAVLTESMDKPTAMASGKVIDLGQTSISDHGFCWDNTGAPNVDGQKLTLGKMGQTGNFSGIIPGLSPKTVYYLKAWVSSENGVIYGDLLSFLTPDLPAVILQVSGEISDTSARCSVDVTSDGGAPVIVRGVCWNTAQTPDTNNLVFRDSIHATGAFIYTIFGLTAGTKYYTRAFAKNIYGIRYSDETSFTTAQSATIPVVTTTEVSNIAINSVTSGGNVTSDGGASVTIRGVCWNTTPYPTIELNKTTDGIGTGLFVSSVTGITANTTYYLRSYATNSIGTGYGEEKSFTTLPNPVLPTVITTSITNITTTSATSGGTVLTDGGNVVTARGVCWSAAPNPTSSNTHTVDGGGLGTFVSNVISLVSGTKYYVRAYASNSAGTTYGNELSFTTIPNPILPTVITTAITNITQTTAISGGNVTSDGGSTIIARGVCWSISTNPTTANAKTNDGTGTGTGGYLSSMTGLTPNVTYYVRAYTTNIVGTAYGNEVSFTTTLPCGSSITINHVVGAVAPVAKTVTYGTVTNIPGEPTKCWITSNLGADHQATAVNDWSESSAGWYWQFNRKQGFKHDGSTVTPSWTITSINENLDWQAADDPCALELGSGWRIPTYYEWQNVDASGNWIDWNGVWISDLKIHGAGYIALGDLYKRGSTGLYWTNKQIGSGGAWNLGFESSYCGMYGNDKAFGFPLRCLRE